MDDSTPLLSRTVRERGNIPCPRYTPTARQCSTQMPELVRESSPIKEAKVEGVPSLTSKVKDLHDDLENLILSEICWAFS